MQNLVGFRTNFSSDSITRAANTTAYAAGDAISGSDNGHFTFERATADIPDRKTSTISTVRLSSSANQTTKLDAELWLFRTDITDQTDNSAVAFTDAQNTTRVAIIDIPASLWVAGNASSGADGNAAIEITDLNLPIKGDSDGKVYGQLVARNAYTPVSGEVLTCELVVGLD